MNGLDYDKQMRSLAILLVIIIPINKVELTSLIKGPL